MIKFVLLDLDDTIFDFHKAEHEALRGTLCEMGVTATEEILTRYSEINREHWEKLERGELKRNEVLIKRFEQLYSELRLDISAEKTQAIYEYRLSLEHPFIDGAVEMLEELSKKYSLYIVSNGTAKVQDRRISESGIAKYFKDIFISQRVGADKPSEKFFDHCFSRIVGFERASAIIVGDSLTSDILGGKRAGIATCRLKRAASDKTEMIIPDYEISRLSELAPLLAGL